MNTAVQDRALAEWRAHAARMLDRLGLPPDPPPERLQAEIKRLATRSEIAEMEIDDALDELERQIRPSMYFDACRHSCDEASKAHRALFRLMQLELDYLRLAHWPDRYLKNGE